MKQQIRKLVQKTKESILNLHQRVKKIKEEKEGGVFEKQLNKFLDKIPHRPEATTVHISGASVARATALVILIILLFNLLRQISGILLMVFISMLFATALDPTVDKLQERKIPRALSMLGIYIIIFIILGIFISQLIPLIAGQTIELANKVGIFINNISEGKLNIPFADKIQPYISEFLEGIDKKTLIDGLKTALLKIGEQLQNVAGNAWNAVKIVFNGIFNAVLVLFLTFFFVVDNKGVEKFLRSLFPSRYEDYIIDKTYLIKVKIGSWLRGQFLLMIFIGVITFIGLTILQVEYAATLAMIAGLMEFIPVVGPILSAVPAILIAANTSGWLVLWILILYFIIQQIENNILVPMVMRKTVGLHPTIVIIAMLIGGKFLGLLGVILAVPVATLLSIFVKDYSAKKK